MPRVCVFVGGGLLYFGASVKYSCLLRCRFFASFFTQAIPYDELFPGFTVNPGVHK